MSACRCVEFPDMRKAAVNLDVFYWMLSEFHDDNQLTRKKNHNATSFPHRFVNEFCFNFHVYVRFCKEFGFCA